MEVIGAAVVVVGLLCLIDLLLTFGVIRRLREHSELLTSSHASDAPVIGLTEGERPGPFTAVSSDAGQAAGPRVVAFFAAGCSACPERVPAFIDYLRGNQLAKGEVLAVMVNSEAEPPPYQASLAEVTTIRAEPLGGELSAAFRVRAFPAFCLLDSLGGVLASGYNPAALPALAAR